ncbi:MAG: protein kinase, partial [Lentisphaerae bacterium]|nr:protein kinase [Lentisphaerota bacterium]
MSDIRIPGFQVLEKLGEGGMATVWKALQVSLDRVVAVKVLSSQLASDPEDVQRFQSEAQSAARLKHPGIIQVHDAGIYGGLYYFVMEYIGGYTVGDWVRRKGKLPEKDALLVAECVADALGYAWNTARIIHCDIKPDNVMVDSDGAVKVADLGLARTISGMSGVESQSIMGTPAYVSPEQSSGSPDLDCRADIYSLGAMLYHLVTGTMLFQGESDEDAMDLQISGTWANPCDVVPGLSRAICRLIEMMLAKDPAHRPADWNVVKREIARVRKGIVPRGALPAGVESTVAPRQGQTVRRARPSVGTVSDRSRKSKIGVVVAATVIFAAALLAGYLVYKARGKDEPRPVSVRPVDPESTPVKVVPTLSAEERAKKVFETAMSWARENPDKHAEVIKRLTWAEKQAAGTQYERRAREEILRLSAERSSAKRAAMVSLQRQAKKLAGAGRNLDAADLLEDYRGDFAEETREDRVKSAAGFRRRHQEHVRREDAEKQRRAARLNKVMGAVVDDLWEQETAGARARVSEALADPAMADVSDRLRELDRLLNGVVTADDRVLESFVTQIGQDITVQLQKRSETFVVTAVKDGRVLGEREMKISGRTVRAGVMFAPSELSHEERLQR